MNRRAPFIVVEGLDRSGKTTQTSRLHSRIKSLNLQASLMKFPDRTTAIGKMIDSYLRSASELDDHAIHLLFSANRWELAPTIEKLLSSGTTVICDRYAFSGVAFSASKIDKQGNPLIPFEWCRNPDVGLPAPDIVLFFDITPEKARERGGYGDERYEKEEMQSRVRNCFLRIGEEMDHSSKDGITKWVKIDAGREMGVVEEDVWRSVETLVTQGLTDPLKKLWVSKDRQL